MTVRESPLWPGSWPRSRPDAEPAAERPVRGDGGAGRSAAGYTSSRLRGQLPGRSGDSLTVILIVLIILILLIPLVLLILLILLILVILLIFLILLTLLILVIFLILLLLLCCSFLLNRVRAWAHVPLVYINMLKLTPYSSMVFLRR